MKRGVRLAAALALFGGAATALWLAWGQDSSAPGGDPPEPHLQASADPVPADQGEAPAVLEDDGLPDGGPPEDGLDPRRRRLLENMWWHDGSTRELLALRSGQVEAMDAACRRFLTRPPRDGRRAQRDFFQSLGEGDLGQAEAQLDRYGAAVALAARAEGDMMLEILGMLDADQLETMVSRRPMLLSSRWLLRLGPRKGRGGPGRGAGGAADPLAEDGGGP
ncbi:MAG: hypothetical protein AAGN66_29535 [Acidobacteriota bacterium]